MNKKRVKLSSSASASLSQIKESFEQALSQETERAKESESQLSASIANKLSAKRITWGYDSNINDITTQGIYIINGERTNGADGLPIINSNPGHTIAATLIVNDSTINSNERCVTQFLILSNRMGADGNIYIRTATGDASGLSWGAWGKMTANIEVGQVNSLNDFIDNGIYSGIYFSDTEVETFIMIVINNYLAAGSVNATRSISQFKYALALDGTVSFKSRAGGVGYLGSWRDINAPLSGYSDSRPYNPETGCCFFDTVAGIPLWWNGSSWVDATGKAV